MPRIFRAQPDARTIVQPQSSALWLLLRHLKPFTPPDALNPLAVHMPACVTQERCHTPIAITTILACQLDNVCGQGFLVIRPARNFTLRRLVLAQNAADAAFRDRQFLADMINTAPPSRGAQ
jgi:hypothetical protein